jgi:beta-glucosidase
VGQNLSQAVGNGSVAIDRVNDMVTRTMASFYYLGQNDSFPNPNIFSPTVQHPILDVQGDHSKIIREAGAAGHVLVKNVKKNTPASKAALRQHIWVRCGGQSCSVDKPSSIWQRL